MAAISHVSCQMVLSYQKGLTSPLPLLLGFRNVKTTYRKSWPENLFPGVFPFFWGGLTTCISPLYLVGDKCHGSSLVFYIFMQQEGSSCHNCAIYHTRNNNVPVANRSSSDLHSLEQWFRRGNLLLFVTK